jgi:hypothetical protein
MSGHYFEDLNDFRASAASGPPAPEPGIQRALPGVLLGSPLTGMGSGVPISIRSRQHLSSREPLFNLSEQLAENIAVFPKTDRVIANDYGVYVPQSLLGQNSFIRHEERQEPDGSFRVIILARPRDAKESLHDVESIECKQELKWLSEHRHEYAGQWVALDGDRLIASGPEAREVYERARRSGIELPFVVQIEPSNELPFAGW